MKCKCNGDMQLLICNEYLELYCCIECFKYALISREMFEDIEWLEGVKDDVL